MTKPKGKKRVVKAWAVCFVLNKQCLEDGSTVFRKYKTAKEHIRKVHDRDGGFTEDHHIVPVTITYHV